MIDEIIKKLKKMLSELENQSTDFLNEFEKGFALGQKMMLGEIISLIKAEQD